MYTKVLSEYLLFPRNFFPGIIVKSCNNVNIKMPFVDILSIEKNKNT